MVGLNPEVDLFCASITVKNKNKAAFKNEIHIEHFAGVLGDIVNSQVTVYDYSSIYKFLKERNVPQAERNQIENILDELKDAPVEKKPPLIERAKEWVIRNKEFLGTGIELVKKAIDHGAQ